MMTLAEVNAMDADAFVAAFGDVAEHSPWVASKAGEARPFASRESMIGAFEDGLKSARRDRQLALIRAHPDLATKAKLTDDSSKEQAGAGLNTLSVEELSRFTALNGTYRSKFGFPFIFAVRGATKYQILASFAERVNNGVDDEFAMAIAQICRIFRFRIEDRISP